MMKKLFAIIVLGMAAISIAGCGGGGTSSGVSGKTTVTINIGTTNTSARTIAGIPSNITSIDFSVSGPDMETITKTVSTAGKTAISETFEVPSGLQRHFIIKAKDAAGTVVCIGDAYSNLHGLPVHLSIDMATINLTGTWSAEHVENSGANAGRDCITLSQTGNSLQMLPTYTTTDNYTGSGFVNGDQMQLTFTTGRVDCGIGNTTIVTGIVFDGNSLTGTFVVNTGCGTTVHGTWKAIRDNACVPIESQPPVPNQGTGSVSGKITNALTGQGAANITINLRAGKDIITGPVAATTTTQSDGTYTVAGLNAGEYTAEASGSGYITTYFNIVCVANTTTPNQNAAISPVLATGETRIVLTWAEQPYDLDSHLTGPAPDSSRFHIYFGNPEYSFSGTKYADLDLDDTSSYGPETTTIYKQISGTYKFYVHDFSNSGSTNSNMLSNSGATVRIYRGSSLVSSFNVPANQGGTVWTVFELNGDAITPINTLSYNETGIQGLSVRKTVTSK